MAAKLFSFLLAGIIWFSTASVVYFFYHESTLQSTSRREIYLRVGGDSRTENDEGNSRTRVDSDLDGELLGQLGRDVPRFGPGENGQPVLLYGEAKERAKDTMRIHNFNLVVSEMVSVQRTLADTRHKRCKNEAYHLSALPSVSVIIAFYNEAWSALLRTIYSILNRSPHSLLKEIILVDDYSDNVNIVEQLKTTPRWVRSKVRLVQTNSRAGVAKARLEGVKEALGEVLVFLDSHCEVNTHWLEPLLDAIKRDRSMVAAPIIDVIDHETLEYTASGISRSVFKWDLSIKLSPLSKADLAERESPIEPLRTPVLGRGIFAVDRNHFERIGSLDPQMEGWGGESLELSLRVWMCGGNIKIIPCSRVGHIDRQDPPYNFPGGVEASYLHNLGRIAEVWLDDYKRDFYASLPEAQNKYYGDVADRQALRQKLACHPFQWYLEKVYPSLLGTAQDQLVAWGRCHNKHANLCVDTLRAGESKPIGVSKCGKNLPSQAFMITLDSEIRWEDLCLDLADYRAGHKLTLEGCHGMGGSQEWKHDKPGHIIHRESGMCLDIAGVQTKVLVINVCTDRPTESWEFAHYKKHKKS
ncbi:polypeptide N-acetylgalactosaminyltransferase 13-like [Acanthaster planci]|uniref:Polypeptide N-acetylgalactosaminyltransferase n=1 Tax=Acanthaster planci TaxID=133434 RepID=A0A8B7XI23_ACAPL|nr:polypeptide N-acetylgalactosaminyltransferase 13-like [Acanthaster planci]